MVRKMSSGKKSLKKISTLNAYPNHKLKIKYMKIRLFKSIAALVFSFDDFSRKLLVITVYKWLRLKLCFTYSCRVLYYLPFYLLCSTTWLLLCFSFIFDCHYLWHAFAMGNCFYNKYSYFVQIVFFDCHDL